MAIQQYGTPYRSTASNQNTAAYQTNIPQLRQQAIGDGGGQQTQYTTGQQGARPSNNPWGTSVAGGTGPYNPNQTPQMGYNPSQLPAWQQQTPTAPQHVSGTPQQPQTWAAPQTWTPASFNTQALRDQNTAYMQATLPYQQFMQNNYQYGTDFNEAQRRWDNQNGWQQQMDQYNMGLTGRQQQFNEWQAGEAANQWGAQFGWQQQNDLFSQGLANRQLTGDQWYQQQQVGIAQQQNRIDEMYKNGQLDNEQRQLALAELSQQQDNAFRNSQLAEQMGWNREELASTNAYRQQQDQLARWQQQQQMQMQAAELAAARQSAVLAATGRTQGSGPNVIWQRRF